MDNDEVKRVLSTTNTARHPFARRDTVLINRLLTTGIPRFELINLNWQDVNFQEQMKRLPILVALIMVTALLWGVAAPQSASATAPTWSQVGTNGPFNALNTTSLPSAIQVSAFSQTLGARFGTPPYTWSVSAGSLPEGLNLNPSTGAITGTPTAAGTFNFTVQVTDSGSPPQTATQALSIWVNYPLLTITEYTAGLGSYPNYIMAGPDGNLWFTNDACPAAPRPSARSMTLPLQS